MIGTMTFWEDWEKRRKKRGSPFFPDIEKMIEDMEKEIADFFKEMEEEIPDDLSHERVLPNGSIKKEYGPFVYGYSVKIGKDGKPIIREFGNMKQNLDNKSNKPVYLQEAREPLIDIIEEIDQVKIIAEIPGVEKEEINLFLIPKKLTINVTNPDKKYFKEIDFLFEVDENTATSTYKNGILETTIKKKTEENLGQTKIKIQ
ncbi:Hsp20/alpha crystallin family protein [Candidatus Bathyarchaeota archaeon]|nr:Hsp20/alpha crystallin family protein [Candidatus Bathyarchaeota archaeon]